MSENAPKKRAAVRWLRAAVTLPTRVRDLELAAHENRQLNRRVAELTDIVAELLVPATDRDEAKLNELLGTYRRETLAP
jgi:hypothetical protein